MGMAAVVYILLEDGTVHRGALGYHGQLLTDERCNLDQAKGRLERHPEYPAEEVRHRCEHCFGSESAT